MARHNHRATRASKQVPPVPFFYCCNPSNCNPMAHGGHAIVESCSCGADRRINVNGQHREAGPWHVPQAARKDGAR